VRLPSGVPVWADRGPDWAAYVQRLPRRVEEITTEWGLVPDGEPWHGYGALVVPVRTADEEPAVLKLVFEDDETAEVVAGFYSRLHVPAPPQLRTITSYVARWTDALAALPRDAPIPHRLVEQALAHARDLAADPASTGTLVHNDLHDENVLAADREPWLVIDPQPMSGDPHSEPAPLLWNRWDEVQARGRVRDDVRSRFHAVVDTAGLDEDRARAWVVVRMVLNAYWSVEDAERHGRPLAQGQKEWITRCITIVKAVQD
jgi:streptomycin 6-kinase